MAKMIIIEGNSNDKDNVRAFMVKGEPGDDGVSPTVDVTRNTGYVTISITDSEGTHTANIYDGDLTAADIIDNLTSTATDQALSANQGKVLKGLVDSKADSNTIYTKTEVDNLVNGVQSDTYQVKYYDYDSETYRTINLNFKRVGSLCRCNIQSIMAKTDFSGFIKFYNTDGTPFVVPSKYESDKAYIVENHITQDATDPTAVLMYDIGMMSFENQGTTETTFAALVTCINKEAGQQNQHKVAETVIKSDLYWAKDIFPTT